MAISGYVLIIANTGRMLAEAAAKAGLKPLVIDLCNDIDTRRYADDVIKIPTLSKTYLEPALDYFIEKYSVRQAIYGSGFENHPESLNYLNDRLTILGNSPDTFIRLHDKAEFFLVLTNLSIDYSEVAFAAPDDGGIWLVKPMRGQGGLGIRRYKPGEHTETSVYWQKYQPGSAHSVLFLADGQQAQIIGFNSQWTVCLNESEEFVFAGVINDADINEEQKTALTAWINRCVKAFLLKGLNSLDFIKTGDQCRVLEINARPPASMQLYENDLLSRHILAVQGVLLDGLPDSTGYTGYQIVYAEEDSMIPDRFDWPKACRDIPESGVICRKGQPICSIISHQNESRQVRDELAIIQQQIVNQLKKVQPHGI